MKKLYAVVDMALRKSPDKGTALWKEFFEWPAGTEFEPPKHLKIDLALQRRIAVWAGDSVALAEAVAFHEANAAEARRRTALLNEIDEVAAIQDAAAQAEREREDRERVEADKKRTDAYLKAYEKRQAEEARIREAEAAAQAEREAVSPDA